MNQKNNTGFTLIELLVVIAIISLLTSVTLASLSAARTKAVDAKIATEYRQIQTSLEIYYNENGKYPTPSTPKDYCIGATNCLLAGVPVPDNLATTVMTFNYQSGFTEAEATSSPLLAAAAFTYKPNNLYTVKGTDRGFIYHVPPSGTPSIIFGTNKEGVRNATVGVWTLSTGSN